MASLEGHTSEALNVGLKDQKKKRETPSTPFKPSGKENKR